MSYRKKLIEVALPLEAINIASAREKSIRHGHPSTLHLWWARRPLAACRAVIFASLVDDPDDPAAPADYVAACRTLPFNEKADVDTPRQRLFKFIELLVQWESTTDEKVLETARRLILLATDGNPPPLLDPFAGGGSIPLEAQRLGLEAHASDLNPVAVMINKALIEIPPKFANCPPVNPRDRAKMGGTEDWHGAAGLAADVRYYGEWMRDEAWKRIGHLYPKGPNGETVIAWIWARTVKCPNPACGAQMPLVTSFELSKKAGRRAWVEPILDKEAKTVNFEIRHGNGKPPEPTKAGRGSKFRCLVCGETVQDQYMKDEGHAKRIGAQLMAVVTEGTNGRSYYMPLEEHENAANKTQPTWRPFGEVANDHRWFSPPIYGYIEFADLFTPRQLVALTTFSDLAAHACEQAHIDALAAEMSDDNVPLRDRGTGALAYAEAMNVYLAFAVDRLAEKENSFAGWQNTADFVRGVFSRQAIGMVWDYAEVNPFSGSTGNFGDSVEWVAQATESINFDFSHFQVRNSVSQQDAASTLETGFMPIISTDPPYADNVGYADLSDFFYVWMRRSLSPVYPNIFGTMLTPKTPELIISQYRFPGDRNAAGEFYEKGMYQTFVNLRKGTIAQYPTTIYYAYKQQEDEQEYDEEGKVSDSTRSSFGWETMLNSLINAGYIINGTWPMRTERGGRSNDIGANALASSIVLVCRPRPDDAPTASRRQFIDALRREVPAALRELQSGNIAPVDLAQASIGPGMAIYSRYSQVLEASGAPMTVRTALQLINQELDTFLAEQEGDIDADSRFAVSWFEQFGFNEGEFGQADVLARAKNTSVAGVVASGIVEAGRGKVRLRPWGEYDPGAWDPKADQRPTAWEAVHHLIERLNTHGEQGAAMLMVKMPGDMSAAARELAYRLYNICERKGWAEYAYHYNALVISWPAIQEAANELRRNAQKPQQQELFGAE